MKTTKNWKKRIRELREDKESINYQTRETKKNEVQVVGENEIDDKSK